MIALRLLSSAAACAAIGASAFLMAAPAAAQQLRLEEERIEGVNRLCIYRSTTRQESRTVGRGEPCPHRFRRPVAIRQDLPSFAVLDRQGYERGRPVCIYRYQQREYRQPASASGFCSYTPVAQPR
jgi:hypothetical protein